MSEPMTDEGRRDADLARRWTGMEDEIRRLREEIEQLKRLLNRIAGITREGVEFYGVGEGENK